MNGTHLGVFQNEFGKLEMKTATRRVLGKTTYEKSWQVPNKPPDNPSNLITPHLFDDNEPLLMGEAARLYNENKKRTRDLLGGMDVMDWGDITLLLNKLSEQMSYR